jgi:hypothetical protein
LPLLAYDPEGKKAGREKLGGSGPRHKSTATAPTLSPDQRWSPYTLAVQIGTVCVLSVARS